MLARHSLIKSSHRGGRLGSISIPLLLLGGTFANAQEALRTAINADRSLKDRQTVPVNEMEPLRAGPVEFFVGISYASEYTDNVQNVKNLREEDFIQRPQLDLRASMPVSQTGRISLGAGIGYAYYLNTDNLNRLFFSPNSELAYDFLVKDFQFTFYDNFSYSYDVQRAGGLAGVSQFPHFENTVGTRATWSPSQWSGQAGYSHYNFISDGGVNGQDFSYLDRSSEQFYARVAYSFAPATKVGMEASTSLTDYVGDTQADNTSFSIGPYLEWQITEALALTIRGGSVHYSFDSTPGSPTAPLPPLRLPVSAYGLDSYYATLGIDHRLTAFITHGISFTHELRPGVNEGSELTESDAITYQAGWTLTENTMLGMNFSYEKSTESQTVLLAVTDEKYELFRGAINISYRVSRQTSVSASYSHARRTSNEGTRDYFVSNISLGLRYQF